MANAAITVSVGTALGEGKYGSSVGASAVPLILAVADQTAVEAAVAVLEADAASPTQAHVTALRAVWNTLKTDAAAPTLSNDVVVLWNAAVVTTRNQLRAALRLVASAIEGGGTPAS